MYGESDQFERRERYVPPTPAYQADSTGGSRWGHAQEALANEPQPEERSTGTAQPWHAGEDAERGMEYSSFERRIPENEVIAPRTAPLAHAMEDTVIDRPWVMTASAEPYPLAARATTHSTRASGSLGIAFPPPPTDLTQTGIDVVFLQELTLKHIVAAGVLTGGELAARLRLPMAGVVEELVQSLRQDGYLEFMKGSSAAIGVTGMRLRASERGQEQGRMLAERSAYVGPAPISLRDLEVVLRQHASRNFSVERANVHQAVTHLVLADATIDRLGAGLENGGPILLYGHAGNGKTALAASIAWMLSGGTLVPYAVEIDGYILRVFDANLHEPIPLQAGQSANLDARWAYCQRPFVRVGTDVRPHELDLCFNERQREYECPLQLKATGGVLLIDDLGTQGGMVEQLLNRCLEPVATGTDELTTLTGLRVPVPFTSLLVLVTAGDPTAHLTEEHLRRLPCKIEVPDPTPEHFRAIITRACADAGVGVDAAGMEYLLQRCYLRAGRPLRGAHPGELARLLVAVARYFQMAPSLTPQLIDVAADIYFLNAYSAN